MDDIKFNAEGEFDAYEFSVQRCDGCDTHTMCIEYWHRHAPVLALCAECTSAPEEASAMRVLAGIESNVKAALFEIIELSDKAQSRYR